MISMPTLTIKSIIELTTDLYTSNNFKDIPSIMLWGSPGIGKSDAVRTIANNIGKKLNKKEININEVILSLFSPVDLRGLPVINDEHTAAIWLIPEIFKMDSSDDILNVLFLDEITTAPPSIQVVAYRLVLERAIGEHKLPDNCIIIAAGNKTTDRSVAYTMSKALANRFIHFEATANFEEWQEWAIDNNIDHRILGYLNWKKENLTNFNPENQDFAYATPRSWEMLSSVIKNYTEFTSIINALISGTIGNEVAIDFINFCKNYNVLPNVEDIYAGKCLDYEIKDGDLGVQYALTSVLIFENSTKKTEEELNNMLTFVDKVLSKEFMLLILSNIKQTTTNLITLISTKMWKEKIVSTFSELLAIEGE